MLIINLLSPSRRPHCFITNYLVNPFECIGAPVLSEERLLEKRCLTCEEAAGLLWVCWRMREQQVRHRGTYKGGDCRTTSGRCNTSPLYLDWPLHRFSHWGHRTKSPNKRQAPVRIPLDLFSHLRRWHQRRRPKHKSRARANRPAPTLRRAVENIGDSIGGSIREI